jgi:REP-associated tyrosine transposase
MARRRRLRLKDYDYGDPGAYFITICSHQRVCLFGRVQEGVMARSPYGEIVAETWREEMETSHATKTDKWIVMPNHFHAIVLLEADEGGSRAAPWSFYIRRHDPSSPSGMSARGFEELC